MGLVLGLIAKIFILPSALFIPLDTLGLSATPVALFAIGLSLSFGAIKSSYKATIVVILAKMLLAPIVFLGLINLLGFDKSISVLNAFYLSSMPTATVVCAMVIKAKKDVDLAVSSVAFGLVFVSISVPLLVNFVSF